jgi:hypothetical protein
MLEILSPIFLPTWQIHTLDKSLKHKAIALKL